MNPRIYLYFALSLLITLLGAGCTGKTPQSVYYTLNAAEDTDVAFQLTAPLKDILIGIGSVKFPDELDRPSIVTRSGQNRLEVNEFHRWGGSLEKNFTRVMVENLSTLMKTDQVMTRPWERYFKPDVRITLDIRQFDGRLGEYAALNLTWMAFEKNKDEPTIARRSNIKEPVTDSSYDALVAAQSRATSRLCQEIAEALLQLPMR
jgi:uncharacterized lipoprotein YmbA